MSGAKISVWARLAQPDGEVSGEGVINLLVVAIENWEDRWHTRCVCAAVGSSVE